MAQNILISTLDKIPNYTITETTGVIYYYGDFGQSVRYLQSQAQSKNCNAVINLKWTHYGQRGSTSFYLIGEAVKLVKSKDEKELSEKGLKKESIENLMERSKCSKEQAIKALKECNGDITEALLAIDLNNK